MSSNEKLGYDVHFCGSVRVGADFNLSNADDRDAFLKMFQSESLLVIKDDEEGACEIVLEFEPSVEMINRGGNFRDVIYDSLNRE